ncbi:MAG TPA: hypothetical protein VM186_07065 [Planctomycetota bacterium]|nr:hypothetical protein [Planctomycetota bacterium]
MKRTVHFGFVLPAIALMMMAGGSSAGADDLRPEVSRALEQFDQCRTLAMRAVKNAQDLKTVFTYGRGFALDSRKPSRRTSTSKARGCSITSTRWT